MTIKNRFPDVAPVLNLDFANTKRLDPRITFTRSSTGTYVDEFGVIKTAANNEARFDHDGDGNSLGLLVEEERTNEITVSIPTTTSPWSVSSLTSAITNAATAPDGAYTATLVAADNGNTGNAYVRATFTAIPTNCTFSFFTKDNGVGGCSGLINTTDGQWTFTYNFSTGATSYSGSYVQEIKVVNLPNGWRRVSIFLSGTSTSWVQLNARTSWGGTHPNGNSSTGVYFWGAQAETGSFPTSYIPTSGSTATRSADVASMTGTNFSSWYNQSEGTVIAKARMDFALSVSGQFPSIYTSGTFPDRLWSLYLNNVVNQLTVGADAYSRSLQTFSSSPQTFKVAQALSNTDLTYSASKDGAAPLTGSLSKSITNTTSLSIGASSGAVKRISRLAYYDRRLTDAQLQALTL